jgi:hypothetical protein
MHSSTLTVRKPPSRLVKGKTVPVYNKTLATKTNMDNVGIPNGIINLFTRFKKGGQLQAPIALTPRTQPLVPTTQEASLVKKLKKRKNPLPTGNRLLGCPVRSTVAIPTELSQFLKSAAGPSELRTDDSV